MLEGSSKGLSIKPIKIRSVEENDAKSMHIKTKIIDGKKIVETKALIDSGTQGGFIRACSVPITFGSSSDFSCSSTDG